MRLFIISTFIFLFHNGYTQYVSWGNDKGTTKWEQIKTENFQVIYPQGYDSVAQLFCKKLNYIYSSTCKSLGHQPKKISVLLHNQSTISNAFVAWAPSRMEVFGTPDQSDPALEWFELLAIHEYRHVVQTDMINTGLTRIFYYLMGEQAVGAVLGLYVPTWFLEGDAVCMETALTESGRGRTASFSMGLRAQIYDKGIYSYDKAYFGSYKDFVPNHYKMGYYMVANVRQKYGAKTWMTTLQRVGEKPLSITPFNKGLKLATGKGKLELYTDVFEKQQEIWGQKYNAEGHSPFDTLTNTKYKEYTNFTYAQKVSNNLLLVEKSGQSNIPYIVSVDKNGFSKNIIHVGFKNQNEPFSANDMCMVWTEENSNIRWELSSTQDIYTYTFSTEKTTVIKTGKRIFSPTITHLGDKIAAVRIDEENNYSIVIYNTGTKEIVKEIPIPNNEFPQTPKWNSNGKDLVLVTLSTKGKRIIEINTESNLVTEIHPYTRDDIANPCYWKDFVFYSSSYSGVDNIYAIHKKTKEIARLTSSAFGAKYPSVHNDTLLFSDYTSNGFVIGQKEIFPRSWYSIDVIKKEKYDLASSLASQEGKTIDFSQIPDTLYASKPYSKLLHLFNIHSWMPFYYDTESLEFSTINNGVQFVSQNKLSTMVSSFGYREKENRSMKEVFANFTYTGFYPIIITDVSKGTYVTSNSINTDKIEVNFDTKNILVGTEIPFDFSSRSYYRTMRLASYLQIVNYEKTSEINVTQKIINNSYPSSINNGALSHSFSITNQRKSVAKDLGPKYAQQLIVGYLQNSPFATTSDFSNQYYAASNFYFPGLTTHHSLQLYTGYQYNKDINKNTFRNSINLPYSQFANYSETKQLYSTELAYSFPIAYPDISLGPITYIKRIRAKVFVQYAALLYSNNFVLPGDSSFSLTNTESKTYGIDLNIDLHLFRLLPELNLGCRYVKDVSFNSNYYEFLFNYGF